MEIFSQEAISNRRKRLESVWNSVLSQDQAILVFSGEPIQIPGGLDQCYKFYPHPGYFWLSGRRRPNEAVLYSKDLGWVDFRSPVSRDEVIWEGAELDADFSGHPFDDLPQYIKSKAFSTLIPLGQVPPSDLFSKSRNSELLFKAQEGFDAVRRQKDPEEVALIQKVSQIAHKGYLKLKTAIRPGVSEKEVRLQYESEILREGAHGVPYETIVGTGTNSAILHAIPTHRVLQKGEMVLIDAGAEIADYCVDITRVYPVEGEFNEQQKALYDLVKKTQVEAVQKCQVGVAWNEIHLNTARSIATGLKDFGILKSSVEDAVESEAIACFYPHGVGHMVGLRVRDVGHEQNINPKKYAGARIRIDLELKENFLVTVEPGCYFIKAFIEDSEIRSKYQDIVNWSEVEKWKHIGGVRIEDDILITVAGPKNLTDHVEK